jgi:small subunit ribosomal protein S11
MGKKRVIEKSEEEVLAEKDELDVIKKKKGKAKKKGVEYAYIYISASYNNTMMTLTDKQGKVLAWSSAGNLGFKGTKKATPYAASEVANVICEKAEKMGVKEMDIFVKGVGTGRSSALRALSSKDIIINLIKDITPIPHNGCRPKRPRRV